jgi:hypothetical protein
MVILLIRFKAQTLPHIAGWLENGVDIVSGGVRRIKEMPSHYGTLFELVLNIPPPNPDNTI